MDDFVEDERHTMEFVRIFRGNDRWLDPCTQGVRGNQRHCVASIMQTTLFRI